MTARLRRQVVNLTTDTVKLRIKLSAMFRMCFGTCCSKKISTFNSRVIFLVTFGDWKSRLNIDMDAMFSKACLGYSYNILLKGLREYEQSDSVTPKLRLP